MTSGNRRQLGMLPSGRLMAAVKPEERDDR
jgi:hypothetical protein